MFDCRVDGKDVVSVPQRRLSFDCKTSKFSQQSDIISHGSSGDDVEKVGPTVTPAVSIQHQCSPSDRNVACD